MNDPDVLQFSNQRFINHSYESCWNYLKSFDDSTNKFLLIEDRFSGTPFGTLTIYIDPNHRTADIGLMVGDKDSWGTGIGSDAFYTALNHLTNSKEIRKITAGTLAINKGMVRVLEKAGLTLEAVKREQELVDNHPVDILYFAKFCYA